MLSLFVESLPLIFLEEITVLTRLFFRGNLLFNYGKIKGKIKDLALETYLKLLSGENNRRVETKKCSK